MPETVFLHVGAHRTGSTHLHSTMKRNAALLAPLSARFLKLHDVADFRQTSISVRSAIARRDWTAVDTLGQTLTAIYRRILAETAERHLLMSFEDHLGPMGLHLAHGLYPAHASVVAQIADAFAGLPLTVALSVRSYDEFIESTYKYAIRSGYAEPFAAYLNAFEPEAISWLPIVANLLARFGRQGTAVWSYEAYAADPAGFCAWMVRGATGQAPAAAFRIGAAGRNASGSELAVGISLETNRLLAEIIADARLRRQSVMAVNKVLERTLPASDYGRPALLEPALRERLRERYRRDIAEIRTMIADSTFLTAGEPSVSAAG